MKQFLSYLAFQEVVMFRGSDFAHGAFPKAMKVVFKAIDVVNVFMSIFHPLQQRVHWFKEGLLLTSVSAPSSLCHWLIRILTAGTDVWCIGVKSGEVSVVATEAWDMLSYLSVKYLRVAVHHSLCPVPMYWIKEVLTNNLSPLKKGSCSIFSPCLVEHAFYGTFYLVIIDPDLYRLQWVRWSSTLTRCNAGKVFIFCTMIWHDIHLLLKG